mgnify:FL=1
MTFDFITICPHCVYKELTIVFSLFYFSDFWPPLSLGQQLHWSSELPILFHVPNITINPYDLNLYLVLNSCHQQKGCINRSSCIDISNYHGYNFIALHTHFWTDGLSYGASEPGSNYKWTSYWKISWGLQSIFQKLLLQLLLHTLWATISKVIQVQIFWEGHKSLKKSLPHCLELCKQF